MANKAAALPGPKTPLVIQPSVLSKPAANEVLIHNEAVAINQVDIRIQDTGRLVEKWPFILGFEVAGRVTEVGEDVTRFKEGDRVAALAIAFRTKIPDQSGFQLYTMAPEPIVAHIPRSMSCITAVVLPLGLGTAAAGLYESKYLGLSPPSVTTEPNEKEKEKVLLIWGGSSSVGSCAIQLAAASGLTILTTASAKNHEYVKSLGADSVFDHHDKAVVDKLLDAAKGKMVIGVFDTIAVEESIDCCAHFWHRLGGGTIIGTRVIEVDPKVLRGNVKYAHMQVPGGASDIGLQPWTKIWREYMEEGLKNGKLKAKPDPIVVQGGLEKIQDAIDVLRRGVSAAKVVVAL